MLVAMGIAAFICIFNGAYPWLLYDLLPWPVDYEPYTLTHVITQTQLLFFSALAFTLLMLSGLYPPEMRLVNLDADWLVRRLGKSVTVGALSALAAAWASLTATLTAIASDIGGTMWRTHGPRGILSRAWPTGATVMWIAVLLAVYLLVNYVT